MNSVSRIVLALFLAGILACSLQGCGSKTAETEKKEDDKTKQEGDTPAADTEKKETKQEGDTPAADTEKKETKQEGDTPAADTEKKEEDKTKQEGDAAAADTKKEEDEKTKQEGDAAAADTKKEEDEKTKQEGDAAAADTKKEEEKTKQEGDKATVLTDAEFSSAASESTLNLTEKVLYMALGALITMASYLTFRGISATMQSARQVKAAEGQTELPELSSGRV